MERLDVRAYCAAITSANGVVRITATEGPDSVHVDQSSTLITVRINGETHTVARAGVKRIDAFLRSGDDTYNAARTTIPSRIYGELGDDRLYGGAGRDRIFGSHGNDLVVGNGGRDDVEGGPGIDSLYGGIGADNYFAKDGGNADRLFGLTVDDIVYGDIIDAVAASHSQNDRTNAVWFRAETIELRRATIPGVDGIFYRAHLNGRQYGDVWRAAGVISLFTPRSGGSVTIDPQLRSELDGRGWLNIESLA